MDLVLDLKNYDSENSVFKRTAARGIVKNGNLYLMIFSKYGDYKFPGGGMKHGGSLEETVIREVQEETGFRVIRSSIKEYGTVHERRKGEYDDVFEMDSHYFICDVESEAGSRNLDDYEAEYDYQIVWMTLQEAMKRNSQVSDLTICPWVVRETKVMEILMREQIRCSWAGNIPIYVDYHDNEWGRPVHDDVKLFEMLILEGMQAGLTWITVLNKREAFREAFDGFDPTKVALYDDTKIQELMTNERIIRNRLKINAAVSNAKVFLKVIEEYGSFDKFIWGYVDYVPIIGHWEKHDDVPASTPLSDKMSKDLKKMGFKFVGSTIIYAFMQATGMVNDHITKCFIHNR